MSKIHAKASKSVKENQTDTPPRIRQAELLLGAIRELSICATVSNEFPFQPMGRGEAVQVGWTFFHMQTERFPELLRKAGVKEVGEFLEDLFADVVRKQAGARLLWLKRLRNFKDGAKMYRSMKIIDTNDTNRTCTKKFLVIRSRGDNYVPAVVRNTAGLSQLFTSLATHQKTKILAPLKDFDPNIVLNGKSAAASSLGYRYQSMWGLFFAVFLYGTAQKTAANKTVLPLAFSVREETEEDITIGVEENRQFIQVKHYGAGLNPTDVFEYILHWMTLLKSTDEIEKCDFFILCNTGIGPLSYLIQSEHKYEVDYLRHLVLRFYVDQRLKKTAEWNEKEAKKAKRAKKRGQQRKSLKADQKTSTGDAGDSRTADWRRTLPSSQEATLQAYPKDWPGLASCKFKLSVKLPTEIENLRKATSAVNGNAKITWEVEKVQKVVGWEKFARWLEEPASFARFVRRIHLRGNAWSWGVLNDQILEKIKEIGHPVVASSSNSVFGCLLKRSQDLLAEMHSLPSDEEEKKIVLRGLTPAVIEETLMQVQSDVSRQTAGAEQFIEYKKAVDASESVRHLAYAQIWRNAIMLAQSALDTFGEGPDCDKVLAHLAGGLLSARTSLFGTQSSTLKDAEDHVKDAIASLMKVKDAELLPAIKKIRELMVDVVRAVQGNAVKNAVRVKKEEASANSANNSYEDSEEGELSDEQIDNESIQMRAGGIANHGATCYRNSALQCLGALLSLRNCLAGQSGASLPFAAALDDFYKELRAGSGVGTRAVLQLAAAEHATKEYNNERSQGDAGEFSLSVCQWLDSEAQSRNLQPYARPLFGFTVMWRCPTCNLAITGDCQRFNIRPTEGSSGVNKNLTLLDHLVPESCTVCKNSLVLSNFVSPREQRVLVVEIQRGSQSKTQTEERRNYLNHTAVPIPDTLQFPPLSQSVYRLVALSYHIGMTLNGGHNTASVRREDGWYYCDDARISTTPSATLPRTLPDTAFTPETAAQLLFYELVQDEERGDDASVDGTLQNVQDLNTVRATQPGRAHQEATGVPTPLTPAAKKRGRPRKQAAPKVEE